MIRAVAEGVRRLFKSDVMELCALEANEGEHTFSLSDGSFSSYFDVEGVYQMVGNEGAQKRAMRLSEILSGSMRNPGLKIQIVFAINPGAISRSAQKAIRPSMDCAKRLNINAMGLLDDRMAVATERTIDETITLVLTTSPDTLTPVERKQARKRLGEKLRNLGVPASFGAYTLSPSAGIEELRKTHEANIRLIQNAFQSLSNVRLLSCHDALARLREHIEQRNTEDWRARLMGAKPSMRVLHDSRHGTDMSHLFTPPIAHQLFSSPPKSAHGMVQIGNAWHGALNIDLLPATPETFDQLFTRMPKHIPWQISFTITTGHEAILGRLRLKESLASIIAWTSSDNRAIISAIQALQEFGKDSMLVTCQIQACTTGKTPEEVRERLSILTRAMESWGAPQIVQDRGDPIEGWLSCQPGFLDASVAMPCAAPLHEIMLMCPLFRAKRPWKYAASLLRTLDSQLFPVAPGGADQALCADLVFAPPGAGKSLKLASDNLSLLCDPRNTDIPRIAIIDVGFSGQLFVDLVRDILPADKKHYAQAFAFVQGDKAFHINPLDTPLGCHVPPPMDRAWMITFLTLLLTPAGAEKPPDRLTEFMGQCLDEAFAYFSPTGGQPHLFDAVEAPDAVMQAIETHGLHITEDVTSWWEVSRILFEKGCIHEAVLAQRFAVPTLGQITSAVNASSALRDMSEQSKIGNDRPINYLNTMLNYALRDNPALAQPSSFAVSEARIVAIDLQQVAQTGSAQGDKQTALYYLLARQMLCASYYLDETAVNEIPEPFQAWHRARVQRDRAAAKKICFDEFHRTRGSYLVRSQVVRDIREGRKYGVRISLLSQLLEDFDDAMVELATNVWIMGRGGSEAGIDQIREKFSPSEDAMTLFERHVTGPSRDEGSSMLYLASLDGVSDRMERILRLTLGAKEIWAYSTTPNDVALRRALVERVGFSRTLDILSAKFPYGTAKDWMDARAQGQAISMNQVASELIAEQDAAA